MEWEKDGKNITDPKDSRIHITNNKLEIKETKIEDLGNYSCRIFKHDGKTKKKNITVLGKSTVSFVFTKVCIFFGFIIIIIIIIITYMRELTTWNWFIH
jgi:Ca2+-dependent lipid-binding protein